ncbi:hypothetical protein CERSUDRAFT_116051 [Gelatoporia subvermispora B]|uniref:Uncharacterized protein n=1 Tax=Ceriporiopsis subvermispora (strain B) TaxID=914234 RepID=M2QT68_CERS8|nr:hypothetical protein CERSUDRAFT_116051 [Gelatoporia subvermispora B]
MLLQREQNIQSGRFPAAHRFCVFRAGVAKEHAVRDDEDKDAVERIDGFGHVCGILRCICEIEEVHKGVERSVSRDGGRELLLEPG